MYYINKLYAILRYIINKIVKNFTLISTYKKSYEFLTKISDIYNLKPVSGHLREVQLKSLEFAKYITNILENNGITPIIGYGSLLGAVRHKGFIPWDDDMDFDLIRSDYEKLIQLAKEKYIYVKRAGNRYWSVSKRLKFEDDLLKKYPNQLIFIHTSSMLQIYMGTSFKDFHICDFFSLDFYSDDYAYKSHLQYIKNIKKKFLEINNFNKEIRFLENEIQNNKNINVSGSNLLYGIDSDPTYAGALKYGEWLKKDDLYPLQKVKFEDAEFWAPNHPEKFLEHRYGNWQKFPSVIEEPRHLKWIDAYNKRKQ